MNERIKELAEQALKSSMVHDGVYRPEGYNNAVSKEFADKFAELIVAECILTIQMGITRDGHNTEKYLRSMKHLKDIKEHFGVEE